MRILITGPWAMSDPSRSPSTQTFPDAELIGFDSGLFAHNLTGAPQLPGSPCSTAAFRRHPGLSG